MEILAPTTRLIAACCRLRSDPDRDDAIAQILAEPIDWDALLDAVIRHRVHAQVHDALKARNAVPQAVLDVLAQRAKPLRMRGLQRLAELVRVTALLNDAGIRVAEIKGMTLGILAYGTTDLKESVDLDLLVSPLDGIRAAQLLLSNGYRHDPAGAVLAPHQLQAIIRNRKDLPLAGPKKVKLELHWRLSHGSGLLHGAGEQLAWQQVEVAPGQAVATLAMPDLVSYLAVHGSLHNWSRMKWLADFDALFRPASEAQKRYWLDHAQMLGADRCLRYAIAVSSHVIGLYSDGMSREAARAFVSDRDTSRVFAHALRSIEAPYPPAKNTLGQKLALARQDFSMQRRLFRRLTDTKSLLRHHLFVEKDILRFPLPDQLRYLYPPLRGVIWASSRLSLNKKSRRV